MTSTLSDLNLVDFRGKKTLLSFELSNPSGTLKRSRGQKMTVFSPICIELGQAFDRI